MNNEKKLEVLNEIHKDIWDWDKVSGHPEYIIELRKSLALLIDYYEDVLGDELENEDSKLESDDE